MKNLNIIAKAALAILFSFVLFGTQNNSFAADVELKDGTPVRLKLAQTVTSADAEKGQLVSFEVLEDVKVGNATVIKQGSLVVATIVEARSKKSFGRKGKLSLQFDYVKAVDGTQVSLRVAEGKILEIKQQIENSEKREGLVSGIIKTTAFAAGVNPLPIEVASGLLKKGKDVGLAQGQLIDVYVEAGASIKVKSQITFAKPTPKRAVQPVRRAARRNR